MIGGIGTIGEVIGIGSACRGRMDRGVLIGMANVLRRIGIVVIGCLVIAHGRGLIGIGICHLNVCHRLILMWIGHRVIGILIVGRLIESVIPYRLIGIWIGIGIQ